MTSEQPPLGVICWFEVPVTSPTRAAKFYASVLGWESEAAAAADDASIKALPSSLAGTESVHMFKKGSLHGCFLKVQGTATGSGDATKGKPGVQGTVATFSVESIEDTLAKVEAGGGKVVVPKTEIGGDMGFFARWVDTEGNLQGIWAKN